MFFSILTIELHLFLLVFVFSVMLNGFISIHSPNRLRRCKYRSFQQYDNKLNQVSWDEYYERRHPQRRYQVIAGPYMEKFARDLALIQPGRFRYHVTKWEKFPDGTDRINIGGFHPINEISGEHVLLLASFHNNDVTLSQFSVMITLLQSFVKSLTVVLPFYPVGTMERIIQEGQVPTANTYAQLFSHLPSCGRPTRLIIYDLHTLQNRFYLHGNTIASLQSTIPILLKEVINRSSIYDSDEVIDCVAFPDDGAAKRFRHYFTQTNLEIITCGKTRVQAGSSDSNRMVILQDGDPRGKHVLIVDDLVQSGGTLYECGLALKHAGAKSVSAFAAHAVFPQQSWQRFLHHTGDRSCFRKFYVTNSVPTITEQLPKNDVFSVLDITPQIIEDLDCFTS